MHVRVVVIPIPIHQIAQAIILIIVQIITLAITVATSPTTKAHIITVAIQILPVHLGTLMC